jgi:hypothetical protein
MRTNHMLGGSASDTLFEELSLAIAHVSAEMALEGREVSAEV